MPGHEAGIVEEQVIIGVPSRQLIRKIRQRATVEARESSQMRLKIELIRSIVEVQRLEK